MSKDPTENLKSFKVPNFIMTKITFSCFESILAAKDGESDHFMIKISDTKCTKCSLYKFNNTHFIKDLCESKVFRDIL